MAIVDLNQLIAPDVVEELDYETILSERKATLVSLYPEDQQDAIARTLLLESEPLVKLLQENAYREVIWRQRVNESARAVMLAYANLSVDDLMADIAVIFHWPPSELNSLSVTELITWREKALQRSGHHHEQ